MKIAFYFQNANLSSIDCGHLEEGNPGMGGTEYAIVSLVTMLSSNPASDYEIILFVNQTAGVPPGLDIRVVDNYKQLQQTIVDDKIDFIVLKHTDQFLTTKVLEALSSRVIIWAHNFVNRRSLTYYYKLKNVVQIVCVGNEQLDLYRDHLAFRKSTVIHNGFFTKNLDEFKSDENSFIQRPYEVTYIGSIIPAKGFHILAKAWKKVVVECPEAVLNVIGSGKLYDRSVKLGRYNIAESSYEDSFMQDLLDDQGCILSSVKFWGVLGMQKNLILTNTRVGVPNPSGESETFGYTALEMQSFGALVTTKKCAGYLETVSPGGILYNNSDNLAKAIIELLRRPDNDYDNVRDFIKSRYDMRIIAEKWLNLFTALYEKRNMSPRDNIVNVTFRLKWLRELNRIVKTVIPGGFYFLPSIMFYESLWLIIKRKIKT